MSSNNAMSFDRDFRQLSKSIAQMGGLVESQVALALESVLRVDDQIAAGVVENDKRIDELDHFVNDHVMLMLGRHESMASDLREVVTTIKIAHALERIGDLAKNTARRGVAIGRVEAGMGASGLKRLGDLVQELVRDVLDAYLDRNADRALAVWRRDQEVDSLHTGLFRELLTYMMEDPRKITACTHLLFIFKNLERIGDHTTNIAENIYYLVHGEKLTEGRAKNDETTTTTQNEIVTRLNTDAPRSDETTSPDTLFDLKDRT